MAKHVRRRRRGSPDAPIIPAPQTPIVPAADAASDSVATPAIDTAFDPPVSEATSLDSDPFDYALESDSGPEAPVAPKAPEADWFGPSALDEETYAARRDVSLASMMMLGAGSYQRIDGIGLARKALEAPVTGDPRLDLSDGERGMLANARAWCMLVHGDLGHRSRLDDPFVLADAERYVEIARGLHPASPYVETTTALLRLRQGRNAEALDAARRAVEAFAALPDHERNGRTQGDATLAVLTLALITGKGGDSYGAYALSAAARAVRTPVDLDDVAFAALMAQLEETVTRRG